MLSKCSTTKLNMEPRAYSQVKKWEPTLPFCTYSFYLKIVFMLLHTQLIFALRMYHNFPTLFLLMFSHFTLLSLYQQFTVAEDKTWSWVQSPASPHPQAHEYPPLFKQVHANSWYLQDFQKSNTRQILLVMLHMLYTICILQNNLEKRPLP